MAKEPDSDNVSLDDIISSKDAAVSRLNRQIITGMGLLESPSSVGKEKQLNDAVTSLTQERSDVALQAYEHELCSTEMKTALKAIQAAEAQMDRVAAKMVTVTGYINFAGQFAGASAKVVTALKK